MDGPEHHGPLAQPQLGAADGPLHAPAHDLQAPADLRVATHDPLDAHIPGTTQFALMDLAFGHDVLALTLCVRWHAGSLERDSAGAQERGDGWPRAPRRRDKRSRAGGRVVTSGHGQRQTPSSP